MIIVFNEYSIVNLENVTSMNVTGKTIGFYFTSGESRHYPFESEGEVTAAFKTIANGVATGKAAVRITSAEAKDKW